MGIADRRKIHRTGNYTRAVSLPASLRMGSEASIAANRLVLLDPRGEIPEDDLLDFLEEEIEPRLWPWLEKLRGEAPA